MLGFGACAAEPEAQYKELEAGEECIPDPGTMKPHKGNGGHDSPTGMPGDNMDDEHSGKADCLYDGNRRRERRRAMLRRGRLL